MRLEFSSQPSARSRRRTRTSCSTNRRVSRPCARAPPSGTAARIRAKWGRPQRRRFVGRTRRPRRLKQLRPSAVSTRRTWLHREKQTSVLQPPRKRSTATGRSPHRGLGDTRDALAATKPACKKAKPVVACLCTLPPPPSSTALPPACRTRRAHSFSRHAGASFMHAT